MMFDNSDTNQRETAMYYHPRTTVTKAELNAETQHVWATWACRAFLAVSVTISVMGAWTKGLIPGALFTVAMGALVILLSQTLPRALTAHKEGDWRTFVQTLVMGFVFALIEATLNHIGLEAMNTEYVIAPSEYLYPAAIGLSLVNIFATDTYTSVIAKRVAPPKPVDLLIRSSRLPVEPDNSHAIRMDNWLKGKTTPQGISTTLAEVAAKMNEKAA